MKSFASHWSVSLPGGSVVAVAAAVVVVSGLAARGCGCERAGYGCGCCYGYSDGT